MNNSADFTVSIHYTDTDMPVLSVQVQGELTNETCQECYDGITKAVNPHTVGVIMDLGGVSYLDSTGLSTLIKLGLENRLRLVNLSEKVAKLLELTQVTNLLTVSESHEEAVNELTGPISAT